MAALAQQPIGEYLDALAAHQPTPGGGAAAGLHLAQGAALLAMVARFTSGPAYREAEQRAAQIAADADRLRSDALAVAEDDQRVFAAVIAAYRLPREDDAQRAARSAAIEETTGAAAQPPLDAIRLAEQILALAEELVALGNRRVLSDVAAAAEAARAALGTAVVTLEINANALPDGPRRRQLAQGVADADEDMAAADRISRLVRRELAA